MENGWTKRIEELEAERNTWHDRAIAVAAHLDYETICADIKTWVYEHKEKVRAMDKRTEELEAENKKLREAIKNIADDMAVCDYCDACQETVRDAGRVQDSARVSR